MDITLTDDQEAAVKAFSDFLEGPDKYMVIQGAAGTGKSTLVKYLIRMVRARYKMLALLLRGTRSEDEFTFAFTATTNKAAAVLSDFMGEDSGTIHSLLKLTLMPDYNTGGQRLTRRKDYSIIYNTLIIVDESSFIDNKLFNELNETTVDCKVLLIGDQYQLAPVKQKVSIMETLKCTKASMNKIMRNSGIIMQTGAQFRETVETGIFKPIIADGTNIIKADGAIFKQLVNEAFLAEDYSINSAKILAWTNAKTLAYNAYIRQLKGYNHTFDVGEIACTNNPIMCNGRMWSVESHVEITDILEEKTIYGITGSMVEIEHRHVAFLPDNQLAVRNLLKRLSKEQSWVNYYEVKDRWLDLRSVYASTVHKSQGSTYHTVFIDLSDIGKCHIATDVARMLYVAISRASHKVVLYGELPPKYQGNPL